MDTLSKGIKLTALFVLSAASSLAWGREATFPPSADTVIYEDSTTFSNGAGSFLFVGPIASGSPRRSLLRFDLSSLPEGATVTEASLSVGVSLAARRADFADRLSAHRVTAAWAEGASDGGTGGAGAAASPEDATWTARRFNAPPGIPSLPWLQPGGDFIAVASATTPLVFGGGRSTFATNAALVADVQGWLDTPSSNHGWILIGQEDSDQSVRRLYGRSAEEGPRLVVTYELPPMAAAPALPAPLLILLAAALARRGARSLRSAH